MKKTSCEFISVTEHYDRLLTELNIDIVYDHPRMQEYMNRWDGQPFLDALGLNGNSSVLEIGVGTGRLARRVLTAGCRHFTGIDMSKATLDRAGRNLAEWKNITLINDDFMNYAFEERFDIIYASLVFMHIEDKKAAITKIGELLNGGGRFVLSASNNTAKVLDMKLWRVEQFPEDAEMLINHISETGLKMKHIFKAEHADILVSIK